MRRLLLASLAACLLAGCGGMQTVHTPHQGLGPDPKLIGTSNEAFPTATHIQDKRAHAARFAAEHTGKLETVELFSDTEANTAKALVLGVFAVSAKAGEPGKLVAEAEVTCAGEPTLCTGGVFKTSTWLKVKLTPTYTITKGTEYWLAALVPEVASVNINYLEEAGLHGVYNGSNPETTLAAIPEDTWEEQGLAYPLRGMGTEEEAAPSGQLVMMP